MTACRKFIWLGGALISEKRNTGSLRYFPILLFFFLTDKYFFSLLETLYIGTSLTLFISSQLEARSTRLHMMWMPLSDLNFAISRVRSQLSSHMSGFRWLLWKSLVS